MKPSRSATGLSGVVRLFDILDQILLLKRRLGMVKEPEVSSFFEEIAL